MNVVELNVNNLEISAQIKTSLQLINTFLIIQAQFYCSSSSKCHIFKHSILSHKILAFFVFKNVPFSLGQWVWRESPFSFLLQSFCLLPFHELMKIGGHSSSFNHCYLSSHEPINIYWREFIIFPFFSSHVKMKAFTCDEGSNPSFILILINIFKYLDEKVPS